MDTKFFKEALNLAKKARGFTSPNPCVGAVIVKDGRIIGRGYHRKAGGHHAEIEAINSVTQKKNLRKALMYVTLEPCCHYGRTAPCTDAIIKAGIKSVYIGNRDPFFRTNRRGAEILKRAGVEVEFLAKQDPLFEQIAEINQPFYKWVKHKLPYVTLKAGITLDGKIATGLFESKWITGDLARRDARTERSLVDAVIIGAGTAVADNPRLDIIDKFKKKKLLRVILAGNTKLDKKLKIFRDENVLIFEGKHVSIKKVLQKLAKIGVQSVFVEGGSRVFGSFNDEFVRDKLLVDKIIFYIAPKIMGGEQSISVIAGRGFSKISHLPKFKKWQFKKIAEDIKVEGVFNFY